MITDKGGVERTAVICTPCCTHLQYARTHRQNRFWTHWRSSIPVRPGYCPVHLSCPLPSILCVTSHKNFPSPRTTGTEPTLASTDSLSPTPHTTPGCRTPHKTTIHWPPTSTSGGNEGHGYNRFSSSGRPPTLNPGAAAWGKGVARPRGDRLDRQAGPEGRGRAAERGADDAPSKGRRSVALTIQLVTPDDLGNFYQ